MQSFPIVIFAAVCCTVQGVGTSACTVFFPKKLFLFFVRMVFTKESIDTAFSTRETTAAGHGGVDLVLRDKVLNGWHFHKVGRKSPAGQVKVLQILPDFPCSMVVKPQKVTVLLISSPEGGVFFFESLPEIRVTQLPGQTAGLLRESIAFDF